MTNDATGRFDELTIRECADLLKSGSISSLDLVRYYSDRIARLDTPTYSGNPPCSREGLSSVLCHNPDAEEIARGLDEERKNGHVRGILHGVPIMLKGNIDTDDNMPTTAGSLALADSRPPRDADLVTRLREAGAIILGKTNLSEWANFRSTHSSSGWSAQGGQTRNPYALDRNPSGSSSGSAVAVSANFCLAAVGTETDGSIISPSSVNGIVGLKPTVGAISRAGIIPISSSQDTAGPMTRTVADTGILFAALLDPGARVSPEEIFSALALDNKPLADSGAPLRGLRLGAAKNLKGFNTEIDRLFGESTRALANLGAEIVEVELKRPRGFDKAEYEVMLHEFKHGIAAYLETRIGAESCPRDLADLIAFNKAHSGIEMKWFGQEIFEEAAGKGPLTGKAYMKARALCLDASRAKGIDAVLEKYSLSAIIAPSGGPAWKIDHILGDQYSGGGSTSLPAAAGYPHLTVPMGFIHGLPAGLSFIGAAWSEPLLLRLGQAFERATKCRRPPEFKPSVD